ncbi:MAG: hypothetical protein V3V31_05460, partial [Methylococcales bacterium]
TYQFSQIHIDATRNATDDFNPFHAPYKWKKIRGNPFGSAIALGFQLEALIAQKVTQHRHATGEDQLITDHQLQFANYQLSFANVVRPGESIKIDIQPTKKKLSTENQISNRVVLRKDRSLICMGYQRESRAPLVFPKADFIGMGKLTNAKDRTYIENSQYFLKRKFMTTSNAKNFLAGSLIDQHEYFDELENRVCFPPIFPVAFLSCALLEKEHQNGYDFFGNPLVYTNHEISIDRTLLAEMKSNEPLNILVKGPEIVKNAKGLGKVDIPLYAYDCYGLVEDNKILYRAKVFLAQLDAILGNQETPTTAFSQQGASRTK